MQTPSITATPQTTASYSLPVLRGLAPVSVLLDTFEGKAALGANYIVTGGIQTGSVRQATLLPFAEQQAQALRDAFITDGNVAELADGLGTTLGAAYTARAHYIDRSNFTNVSPAVADLIAYTNAVTGTDSNAGKYLFANGTTDGKKPVTDEALQILKDISGSTDIFGKAYNKPAGHARGRCLRRLAAVPDRADRGADRQPRLFRRAGRQHCLQQGADVRPAEQPRPIRVVTRPTATWVRSCSRCWCRSVTRR